MLFFFSFLVLTKTYYGYSLEALLMSTHNICFSQKNKKSIDNFQLKKMPRYLELCKSLYGLFIFWQVTQL